MSPTIHVIMPAYDAAQTIERAIKSVRQQSYSQWLLTVVDDGSTDQTASIVERFQREDDRIRLIRLRHVGVVGEVRNRGIRDVAEKYTAFLDADDEWLPRKLEFQLRFMIEHPYCVLSCTRFYIRPEGQSFPERASRKLPQRIGSWGLLLYNPVAASTVMARTEAVHRAGGFDPDPRLVAIEDRELWIRLTGIGDVLCLNELLTIYYILDNSLTRLTDADSRSKALYESLARKHLFGRETLAVMRLLSLIVARSSRIKRGFLGD